MVCVSVYTCLPYIQHLQAHKSWCTHHTHTNDHTHSCMAWPGMFFVHDTLLHCILAGWKCNAVGSERSQTPLHPHWRGCDQFSSLLSQQVLSLSVSLSIFPPSLPPSLPPTHPHLVFTAVVCMVLLSLL